MSLELAIQENTSALRDLIAHISATLAASPTAKTMTAAAYVAGIDTPTTLVDAASTKAETKAETKAGPKTEVVAIDYTKEVKPLLVKVSTSKGRDALIGLLAKFGVTKGDQLPANELANVITEVQTLLAA